jgi:ribosomal protein S18 acetylase RimI-like enzyme
MLNYSIIETLPSPADYNRLRISVGWGEYEEKVIKEALLHSLYCVCARTDDEVIGMARVIGDPGLVFYIQDVIVLPAYQQRRIGTHLMDAIMDFIQAHAHHNTIIGLMAAKGKEAFYEKYGFTSRPNKVHGAGMTMIWREE